MTPENEEAFPYGEVVKLAEKHGGTVIDYSLPEGRSQRIPRSSSQHQGSPP